MTESDSEPYGFTNWQAQQLRQSWFYRLRVQISTVHVSYIDSITFRLQKNTIYCVHVFVQFKATLETQSNLLILMAFEIET